MARPDARGAGGHRLRSVLTLVALLLVAALPAAPAGGAADHTVVATDYAWTPATLDVAPGDTVAFERGAGFHTLASDDGIEGCALPCTRTFPDVGSFAYYCGVHPWMTGVVNVGPAEPTPDLLFAAVGTGQSGGMDTPEAVLDTTQSIDFEYVVLNRGDLAAGAFSVRIELLLEGAWTTVGELAHDGLDAGASAQGEHRWRSDDLRLGRFDARFTVDPLDAIAERSETNNVEYARAQFVTGIPPGLRVPLP